MSGSIFFLPSADSRPRFALLCDWSSDRRPLRDEHRALRLKPIPQRRRREAIILVISRHEGSLGLADQFEIAELKPGLDFRKRLVCFSKADGAGKPVKRLQLLD
jgi:hypothetical protein